MEPEPGETVIIGYCGNCKGNRTLFIWESHWVGEALKALCTDCDHEFVYAYSDLAADMAECVRGF